MKLMKFLLCILAVSMLATACSPQKPTDDEPPIAELPDSGLSVIEESLLPLYFDSEEDLIRAINEAKSNATSGDGYVVIPSDKRGEQYYSVEFDMFNLASISEFYRPENLLEGVSIKEIVVKNEYVSYWYDTESQTDSATFTWFREMAPEVAMNGLFGRGAMSEREVEYNNANYVFLEWYDPWEKLPDGYSTHWVVDGKAYQASIPPGYTDQEMLDFCQFKVVEVPYWPSVDEIAATTISAGTQSVQISKKLDLAAILTFDPEIPDWNVYSLVWVSSNTTLATVNSAGVVTGKSAGMLTVTATLTDPYGGTKSVNFSVKVY